MPRGANSGSRGEFQKYFSLEPSFSNLKKCIFKHTHEYKPHTTLTNYGYLSPALESLFSLVIGFVFKAQPSCITQAVLCLGRRCFPFAQALQAFRRQPHRCPDSGSGSAKRRVCRRSSRLSSSPQSSLISLK